MRNIHEAIADEGACLISQSVLTVTNADLPAVEHEITVLTSTTTSAEVEQDRNYGNCEYMHASCMLLTYVIVDLHIHVLKFKRIK